MIKKALIIHAIQVLTHVNEKYSEDASKRKNLLEDEKEGAIFLQITLKKIPKSESIKMIKVSLPHSLMKDSNEVCLITGDLDKKNHKAEIEPDILHYKGLLEKNGVTCISEVVTLRQLRTDYKPYEAKQKLLAAYDVFLADKKIAECLPRVLGKFFFKKRKFPMQIDFQGNIKKQIEKALSTKVFYVTGHGNSCCSEVAYLDMEDSEITENVMAVINSLRENLPGSWNNIMGIYLKTSKSKAVPVYMSYGDSSDIKMNDGEEMDYIDGDLSTMSNHSVLVYGDGTVAAKRIKKEDEKEEVIETQEVCEPELSNEVKEGKKSKKTGKTKINKECNLTEIMDSEGEDSELLNEVKEGKKSKKTGNSKINKECSLRETIGSEDPEVKGGTKSKKSGKAKINECFLPETIDSKDPELLNEVKGGKKLRKSGKTKINEECSLPETIDSEDSELLNELKGKKSKKIVKTKINKECSLPETIESEDPKLLNEVKGGKKSKKAGKTINEECSLRETFDSLEKSAIRNKKSNMPKRKRLESESTLFDSANTDSPVQALKKRKVEGLNMKKYNDRKKSRKNKRKENCLRNK